MLGVGKRNNHRRKHEGNPRQPKQPPAQALNVFGKPFSSKGHSKGKERSKKGIYPIGGIQRHLSKRHDETKDNPGATQAKTQNDDDAIKDPLVSMIPDSSVVTLYCTVRWHRLLSLCESACVAFVISRLNFSLAHYTLKTEGLLS
jgi:hypothetical protein